MKTKLTSLANEMKQDLNTQATALTNEMHRHVARIDDVVRILARVPARYENGHITLDEMYQEYRMIIGEISISLTDSITGIIKDKYDRVDSDLGKLKNFIATL